MSSHPTGGGTLDIDEKWRLLPEFLKVRGLVNQHIDSYDHFLSSELREIILAKNNREIRSDYDPGFFFRYKDIYVGRPQVNDEGGTVRKNITPHECRLRDETYSAPLMVSVEYTKGKNIFTNSSVNIGKIPIMLKSSKCILRGKSESELAEYLECPHDPGGYFIVKGSEKVVLIQEQLSKNRIILELDSKGQTSASVTSSTHERKSRTSVVLRHDRVYLKHNSFSEEIPIVIVLRAMGIVADSEIASMVGIDFVTTERSLIASFEEAAKHDVYTTDRALDYLGKRIRVPRRSNSKQFGNFTLAQAKAHVKQAAEANESSTNQQEPHKIFSKADEARELLAQVVLSHVEVERFDFREKAFYIAFMVRRCLEAKHDPTRLDDKDYYGNKRLELAGQLLSVLFEDLFKRFNHELKRQSDQVLAKANRADVFDVMKHIRTDTITNGFVHALSTGNWSLKRFKMERAGVTQQLSRLSFMSAIGHMTRITSQFEKTRKVSGPRALQPSQWGMLCPSDTPEGESCGLVKNLSLLTHVTTDHDPAPIAELVYSLGVEDVRLIRGEEAFHPNSYVVMLNGSILGITTQPFVLSRKLRKLRRRSFIAEFVSVFADETKRTVSIATDGGRVCRPLIIVEKGVPKLTSRHVRDLKEKSIKWSDLLVDGIVEYVDVNESNNTLVALREENVTEATTHLEVDPLTILGVVAGLIPFPHHNQSPRNTYQCAMGKQAIGTIGLNQFNRIDTLLYLNVYPQKPLVTTRTLDMIGFDSLPGGQNAVIAVMSYSGYDIEDAVVLNKASLDRGYGRCMVLRKYVTSKKRYANQTQDRIQPPPREAHEPAVVQASGATGEPYGAKLFASDNKERDEKKLARRLAKLDGSLVEGADEKRKKGKSTKKKKKKKKSEGEESDDQATDDDSDDSTSFATYDASDEHDEVNKDERDFGDDVEYRETKPFTKYAALDPVDGIAEVGLRVTKGSILVNREMPRNTIDPVEDDSSRVLDFKNSWLTFKTPTFGVVDKVMLSSSESDKFNVKILTREVRRPELGDKFSSRHGQKGVCGLIVNQEDMPFDSNGVCPDMIMNPHGFPSRMTVGKMIELISGKAHVMDGERRYGTAFQTHDPISTCTKTLIENGFSYTGKGRFNERHHGRAVELVHIRRPGFLSKAKAHGQRQDARSRTRTSSSLDSTAHGGPISRRRPATRRDGARRSDLVRGLQSPDGAAQCIRPTSSRRPCASRVASCANRTGADIAETRARCVRSTFRTLQSCYFRNSNR